MSYHLSDPLSLRRLLRDAGDRLEDHSRHDYGYVNDSDAELARHLRSLSEAIETGPIELAVYSDRSKALRLRVKRKGPASVEGGGAIRARFERFHAANPHVYEAIVRRLRALRDQGVERSSVKAAVEALRWSATGTRRTDTDRAFKIPNDLASRYARLIAEQEPDLGSMLKLGVIRTL